jgi:hypothetical protein
MKKSFFLITFCIILAYPALSQGLLSKVKNSVSKELSGNSDEGTAKNSQKPAPEPLCACNNAVPVIDLGKYQIDYKEITISIKDEGSVLLKDKISGKFYVTKNGMTEGPYVEGDPHLKGFLPTGDEDNESDNADGWLLKYPGFISKAGDKYMIRVDGKSYGPYAQIHDFAVSRSKLKFAAVIVENQLVTEDQGKAMEEAIKNARTDQERMQIAMKYSQQMQQNMMQGGGPGSIQPKIVSNIPGAITDATELMGGSLRGNIKYDDILFVTPSGIMDLQGNKVLSLDYGISYENLFVNTSNTAYAGYNYGTLTFSDKKTLSELFNPYLTKSDGKVFLTYMYYSPSKNSIMQCKLPF